MRLILAASLAVLASVSPASAGDLRHRGTVLLEGGLSFTSTSGEESAELFGEELSADLPDQSRFIVGAVVGGFVTDGFFLGGRLVLDSQSASLETEDGDFESSVTSVSFGVVPRYYIAIGSTDEMFFRVGGLLAYSSVSTEEDDGFDQTDTSTSGVAFGFDLSLVFAFGERQGGYIDLGPFLTFHSLSRSDSDPETAVDLTVLGFQVSIGAFL